MTSRRDFLKYSSALPLIGTVGSAVAQADAIQFGCAVPLSGPFAANGKFADMGMKMAIEKYGKVLGRSVAYSAIDTEGKPATAIRRWPAWAVLGPCLPWICGGCIRT